MAKLSLTRRSFLKASAVVGAASALGFATTPSTALAEGEDASAGEVKRIRSCCRACGAKVGNAAFGSPCRINKVIKVEATNPTPAADFAAQKSQSSCSPCTTRPPSLLHEAHQPQGRKRSWLGSSL